MTRCGILNCVDLSFPRRLTLKRWTNLFISFALAILLPAIALGSGTITGILTSPTTSVPIQNASLSFALSQAGVDVTNTYALATTPVTCATSVTGSVVGIKDPVIAPIASANAAGGSLSGIYYVKIAYYDVTSPTALVTGPSPVLSVSVSGGNNRISITAPALHPFRAIGYKVYVGTVSGSETLQATTLGWGSTTVSSYSVGSALPTNTTACTMTFNDAIIPSFTSYYVTVTDSRGNAVSGFPQAWYLSGTSINIGSSIPIASSTARFQTPILSNPLSSYATQSINSPLTLNGYALSSGNLTITGSQTITTTSGVGLSVQSANPAQIQVVDTVNGSTAIDGLIIYNSSTASGFNQQENAPLTFATNNTIRATIAASGEVGIGTVSPSSILDIFMSPTTYGGVKIVGENYGVSDTSTRLGITDTTGGVGWYLSANNNGSFSVHQSTVGDTFFVDSNNHWGPATTKGTTTVGINAGSATLVTGSNDMVGQVNVTYSGLATVTLTFGSTFSNSGAHAPSCIAQNIVTPNNLSAGASTSSLTMSGTFVSGDVISYHCFRFGA